MKYYPLDYKERPQFSAGEVYRPAPVDENVDFEGQCDENRNEPQDVPAVACGAENEVGEGHAHHHGFEILFRQVYVIYTTGICVIHFRYVEFAAIFNLYWSEFAGVMYASSREVHVLSADVVVIYRQSGEEKGLPEVKKT